MKVKVVMGGQTSVDSGEAMPQEEDKDREECMKVPEACGLSVSSDVQAFCKGMLDEPFEASVGKRPLLRKGLASWLTSSFDVDTITDALVRGSDCEAAVSFKNGEVCMRDNLFVSYLDNCTLSLSEAEHFFRELYELCIALRPRFDLVTARLLLDPPGVKPPPLKTDSHLIVVQLWGEQRLTLQWDGRNSETFPLQPGDALYAPRGVACHVGAASVVPTLYLLLTINTPDQAFGASLCRYFLDALREEGLPPELDAFLRSSVTRHTVGSSSSTQVPIQQQESVAEASPAPAASTSASLQEDEASLETELKRHAAALTSRMSFAGLQEHYQARMAKLAEAQAAGAAKYSGPAAPALPPNKLRMSSSVRLASSVMCRCMPGSNQAHFQRGDARLSLPICKSASHLINELSDGRPHVVSMLPCEDPMERLSVCQVLLFKECLEMVPTS